MHQFNVQQAANASQALDQQRQDTLNGYLDDMSALVLQYDLPKSAPGAAIRAIAVARTLTAVRDLDGSRKGTLIRYLWEAGLIASPQPIVNLRLANLNGTVFTDADLNRVALDDLALNNAQLGLAQLVDADLTSSEFFAANFGEANLTGADLTGSYLIGADLTNATLIRADLAHADLTGANLSDAILTGADLKGARYNLKPVYATNAEGVRVIEGPTRWPRGFDFQAAGMSCYAC